MPMDRGEHSRSSANQRIVTGVVPLDDAPVPFRVDSRQIASTGDCHSHNVVLDALS